MWNLLLMMLSPNTPWVSFILPSLVRMSMMLDTLPAPDNRFREAERRGEGHIDDGVPEERNCDSLGLVAYVGV